MLMDFILANYNAGEPIIVEDITVSGMDEANKRKQLERLLVYGKLLSFDEETVYIPQETVIKGYIGPTPDAVAREKYISRNGKRIGYFGGYTFANLMGISSQVPMKEEIVSNKGTEKESEVQVGTRIYILRKSPVEVTDDNYRILQLLDVLKDLDRYVDDDKERVKMQIVAYIQRNGVSKQK